MVRRYDAREPSNLGMYCEFLGLSKQAFYDLVEPMRDRSIWAAGREPGAPPLDGVERHPAGPAEAAARPKPSPDRALAAHNRHLYFNPAMPPLPRGDAALDERPAAFKVL
jgi:hypothetical protein